MWRWLVFILLAANAGLLLWQWTAPNPGVLTVTDRVAGDQPPLKLYKEASSGELRQAVTDNADAADLPDAESAPEVRALTDNSTPPAPAVACMRVGPFGSAGAADAVASRLRSLGYSPDRQSGPGQISAGFWVYLPPYPSHAAAEDGAKQLKDKGVEDLFIVGGEDNANAISLGLFSTLERAQNRAAAIRKLGFDPTVKERYRSGTVYWLRYREPEDQTLDIDSLGVMPGVDEPLRREKAEGCGADQG